MLIRDIAELHADVVREFGSVDGVQAAATFAGLMLFPELQANHLRLQALTHLSISYGSGRSRPGCRFIQRGFERLGQGWTGMMEDPSEDVFAAIVETDNGNFRLREGVCEAATFHLQRVLNVVATMPRGGWFDRMRTSVEALLKLSDAVVVRAGLTDYTLGDEFPAAQLSRQILARLAHGRSMVHFTERDFLRLGLSRDLLADFEYDLNASPELSDDHIFHTRLQRRPIVFRGTGVYLLLPIAIGAAITRYVAESVAAMRQLEVLESAIVDEYARLFRDSPLLGQGPNAPIHFERVDDGGIAALLMEVDCGRFLQLIFFVEGLEGFSDTGYSGTHELSEFSFNAIQFHLSAASREANKARHFKEGISIVVLCGLGRRIALPFRLPIPLAGWNIEVILGSDFDTLCWIPGFDALSLFRLIASRARVENEGVEIFNVSGPLNLVAWARQLEGHLVPHASVPESFVNTGPRSVAIEQNAVRLLRHDVLSTFDPRRVLDVHGKWVPVRREARSLFDEDKDAPLYFSDDAIRNGRLRSVHVSKKRPYWVECICPGGAGEDSAFQHFEMLNAWLRRAAPIIDRTIVGLSHSPIEFRVHFAETLSEAWGETPRRSEADLRSLIRASSDNSVIEIYVDAGLDSMTSL